ncbi:exported hypothetical protein [Azospirillaceae bacterium]
MPFIAAFLRHWPKAAYLMFSVLLAGSLFAVQGTAAARSGAGDNPLSLFAGATLTRDSSGRIIASFDRDHSGYQIDRLPSGAVTINDIQTRKFSDVRVRDVALLLFSDGWSYDVVTGRWTDLGVTSVLTSKGSSLRICPGVGAGCDASSLAEGLRRATAGSIVTLAPGVYREAGALTAHGVTIRADPGAHITGVATEGKAALVIRGNNVVVEGVHCSNIAVPDHNGACIRFEGRNLTILGAYFHDAEEGVLVGDQGGVVIIEDSRFERLGAIGRAHGVYVNHIKELVIRRSCFLSSRDEGHEVKSRAARTVIENSLIASFDGHDSRLVDAPNGGELIITNSVFEKGERSSNYDVIGFGLEGVAYQANSVQIENTIVVMDHPFSRLLNGSIVPVIKGVHLIGGRRWEAPPLANWTSDRKAAGLPPYSASPDSLANAQERLFGVAPAAMAECLRKSPTAQGR